MKKRIFCAVLATVLVIGFFAGVPLRAGAITQMSASEACIDFIKNLEGFHAIPYWDYAQWTVGFGTACPEEDLERYLQEGIPVEEAEALLSGAMTYFNREVNKFMDRHQLQLTQHQFDALFSMSYNLGAAWMYDSGNRLVKALINGASGNELIYLMGLRSNAGGNFQPGLLKRRLMEADMYLNGRYSAKQPADYATVTYDSGKGTCEAAVQGYDLHLPAQPLAVPVYEGYRFLGWFTEPEGGVRVTELDASTDGMTLYAHWEKENAGENVTGTAIEATVVTVRAHLLNVRKGPGVSYSVTSAVPSGTKLTVTAVTDRSGTTWGKCSQGWISLAHTDYQPKDDTGSGAPEQEAVQLPMDATVMSAAGVKAYNGPHTSYPQRGVLKQGQRIRILQIKEFYGQLWGKFEGGWVKLDKSILLHDSKMLTHSFTATITNTYLNVRNGPGTGYSLAGTLLQGDKVLIVSAEVVDGTVWGRCEKGWISLRYTDFDEAMLPRYQNHTYGSWYEVEASTCTQRGQERRDCVDCGQSEIRVAETFRHSFGDWYEVIAPSYTQKGQQRRDCTACDHYELRETDMLQQPNIHIYGTVTGCSVLNVRSAAGAGNTLVGTLKKSDRVEIYEQVMVNGKVWGRGDKGWFCITGYVTLEVVDEDQPRTMTVTAYQLNIRSGAGSGYKAVGVLNKGDQVTVLETKAVGDTTWARIDRGWVSMKYLK